jgi:hypothetical protein
MRRVTVLSAIGFVIWGWAFSGFGAAPGTQGQLAECLCQKLTSCAGKAFASLQAKELSALIQALAELGIEPPDGWQPEKPLREGDCADLTEDTIQASQHARLPCSPQQAVDAVAAACGCAGMGVGEVISRAAAWGYFFPPTPGGGGGGGGTVVISPNK